MSDDFTSGLEGQRASTIVEGESRQGTITDVTYTPKNGDVVVALSLDDPTPGGKTAVAVALEDIDTDGSQDWR